VKTDLPIGDINMKSYFLKYFSNEKDRVVAKNVIAAFVIKGGALLISFLSLPAYIRYFDNQEVLGVWYTILSVLIWMLSFDFGIGNGLRNKLVGALVRNDMIEVRQNISSAYFVTGAIVVLVSALGFIVFPYVNWNSIFNISVTLVSPETILFAVTCVFFTIMLQFFLRLISFVLYALQKSALNNLMALITSATLFLFVLLAPSLDTETNIKTLSVVYILCVNVPLFVVTIIIFKTRLKDSYPSFRYINKRVAIGILQLGGIFFWNQIMYLMITGTNPLFITKFIGPGSVVNYQIYYTLFSVAGMLFTLALSPMWSAITKAFEENDGAWIIKYFKLSNLLVFIVIFFQLIVVLFLQIIIDLWLGEHTININYVYAITFAIFGSVFVYQSVLSTFACGIGKMKLQAVFYTLGVVVKFIFIYIGTVLYNDWIIIVLSDIFVLLPYCIFQLFALKKHFSMLTP
jgi:O-antigen/teichoic acid export membrane protein